MNTEYIIALCLFAFVSSITPGPNNLMLMASGANFGARRSVLHLSGIAIGFQIMLILVGIGLMNLFNAWPTSFTVLKTLSAGFLIYLAWKIASAAGPFDDNPNVASGRPLNFFQAAAFQWVNPKAWALSLAGLSIYAISGAPAQTVFFVGLAFIVTGVPSMLCWLFLGTQLRRLLKNSTRLRIFNVVCAVLLLTSLWPLISSY